MSRTGDNSGFSCIFATGMSIDYFLLFVCSCMYSPLMCLHFKPSFVYLAKVFYETLSKNMPFWGHFGPFEYIIDLYNLMFLIQGILVYLPISCFVITSYPLLQNDD